MHSITRRLRRFVRRPFKGRVAWEWQIGRTVLQWRLRFENPSMHFPTPVEPIPVPVFNTTHVGRLHVWRDR